MTERKEHGNIRNADRKPKKNHDTEFAAADFATAPIKDDDRPMGDAAHNTAANRSLGWLALALSIASLFVLPQWLGLAGIVLGGAAWFMGTRGLGLWSIMIGAVSLIAYIVLVPYYS